MLYEVIVYTSHTNEIFIQGLYEDYDSAVKAAKKEFQETLEGWEDVDKSKLDIDNCYPDQMTLKYLDEGYVFSIKEIVFTKCPHSCELCKFHSVKSTEFPCCNCKQNHTDYFVQKE